MPTNLPPEYFEVDARYRAASTNEEKAALLEELLSTIPKHKGTDKLRADLRRRLSKLKDSLQASKKVSRHESVYQIEREGAGQVVVIGPPNTGKSALLNALTNATPEVADHPFTTWTPSPGMMEVGGVQIQLIDTPPLDSEYVDPQLLDLIRRSDIVLLVVDLQAYPIEQLEDTARLMEENRIYPLRPSERHSGQRRGTHKKFVVLVNKTDDQNMQEDFEVFFELIEGNWTLVPASAHTGRNLEQLKWTLFEALDIIRVYAKPPGKEPDLTRPYVLKKGSTVEDFAGKVHQDFLKNLKMARLWGSGAFEGQMVSRDYALKDGDIVELKM
jgi:ribosome-interacting GTPase 1